MNRPLQYLLDTDICIYLLNDHQRIKAHVAQVGVETISIAIPTAGELYFGAYNSGYVEANLARIRAFLSEPGPEVLPIDDAAVDHFGRFKADLRGTGRIIGDLDLLIAGVAASQRLKIVTNNTRHFERIPDISLENWLNE